MMDINTATLRDIQALKGVGETLAKRIVKARPFHTLEDIDAVQGMTARILAQLREQDVTAGRPAPKAIDITISGGVEAVEGLPLTAFVLDGNGQILGRIDPRENQRLTVTEAELGKTVTVAVGAEARAPDTPNLERLQRRGFVVRHLKIPLEKPELNLGRWRLDPWWFKTACCRVRGRVIKRITLPNGTIREAPLCNARIEICEVDRSPRTLITTLPTDLIARLRLELIELGTPPVPPVPPVDPPPLALIDAPRTRELRAFQPAMELEDLGNLLRVTPGIEATRRIIADRVDILKPVWCHLEWLLFNYDVDCLKTVPLDANGRFDTDISYFCYGDKPDLYFRIQQKCHGAGWTTVHAPSVSCTTLWNYCCGDNIEIVVTNPDAATGPTPGGCVFPYVADDPASVGEWSSLPDSEVFAVHAAVLHTGKVLLFSGGVENQLPLESRVWDPVTGTFTGEPFNDDLFCAHQVSLADGRILVMGGSNYNGPHGRGITASYTFDPISESWSKHPDLGFGRWYPTAVVLTDGKVLAFSGRSATGGVVDEVEQFDPATNTWTQLSASANKPLEIYPTMHLLKDGRAFYTGCRWAGGTRTWTSPPDTATFDPATEAWADVGPHVIANRTEGTSVLLPPARAMSMVGHDHGEELPPPPSDQKVLVLGGVADSEANRVSAEIIDMTDTNPAWVRIADMSHRRVNPNAVILPDRRVLVVGGVEKYKFDWDPGNVLTCEIFDPTSESWSIAGTMSNARQYHSVSVLLPDGRVMATGTSSRYGNDMSMEVFSPPYLFRGPRPRITSHPSSATYGGMIDVGTPDACRVTDACLIRPGAPTHHTDTEQRLVPLHIHRIDDCGVRLMIPNNPSLLPPGHYMLFILDDCEIPSIGKFIQIQ